MGVILRSPSPSVQMYILLYPVEAHTEPFNIFSFHSSSTFLAIRTNLFQIMKTHLSHYLFYLILL